MSIIEWVAALTLALTFGSIFVKLAFTFIDLKFKAKQVDFVDFVNYTELEKWCNRTQARCPNLVEMSQFSGLMKQMQDVQKEMLNDQKILRQETLPDKYVKAGYFKETIDRIEAASKSAIGEMRIMISGIDKKLDDMKEDNDRKSNDRKRRITDEKEE